MSLRQAALRELARRELARRQAQAPTIKEEQHPGIEFGDRFKLKNFSQSPEASAKWIQENKGLDAKVHNGRVIVKGQGESEWRVIDPDTGFFSTDILNDAADIAYDVGSGVAEGAVGAATGIASMNPVAGIAAAGGTGAASEAIRQGIGASMGINDDLGEAASDTAVVGAASAAVPLLGKLAKPLITSAAKGGKGVVQKLTQATGDDIDVFVNQKDKLDDILNSDSGFTDTFSAINREVSEKERLFKDSISEQFNQLRQSGVSVDGAKVKEIYDRKLAELGEIAARGSDSDKKLFHAMKAERDELFSRTNDMKDIVSTNSRMATKEAPEVANTTAQQMGFNPANQADEISVRSGNARDSFKVADDGTNLHSRMTGGDFNYASKQDISDQMDISDAMNLRQKLSARANFKNKSDLSKSLDSASMSESLAARGYGELGAAIDDVASKIGSKEMRGQFKDHIEFIGDIAKHFKSPESLETFLKAANKGNRKVIAEKLARIDKRFGTNIADKSNLISTAQALKNNADGALTDLTRPKSAMELLGAAVGAKAAWGMGQPWLIPFTLTAGAAIGRKAGSVKAARKYVDFIVETEARALKLDKQAQEILKKKLYKSVTGEDALRGIVTGGATATRSKE